ncbi:MAG: hypothetical protein WCT11_04380 [Candidatus Magasanikbacteria bacterium]
MKKLILLVIVFVFGAMQPVLADTFAVKCPVEANNEFACKNFTDYAEATKYQAELQIKTLICTIASGETCPKVSPTPVTKTETKDPGIVKLDNPLNLSTDIKVIIGTVIKGVLGVMGGLVLLMVVWGGTVWMSAAGNPEKVKSGSQTILWALLGAIITSASYIILSSIMKLF